MDAQAILLELNRRGHRITGQRQLVVEVLLAGPLPQSAAAIYARCQQRDGAISCPTVYRTLSLLAQARVLEKLPMEAGNVYQLLEKEQLHQHQLICQKCGARVLFNACPRQLIAREASRHQFRVLGHKFEIIGLCKDCQAEVRGEQF